MEERTALLSGPESATLFGRSRKERGVRLRRKNGAAKEESWMGSPCLAPCRSGIFAFAVKLKAPCWLKATEEEEESRSRRGKKAQQQMKKKKKKAEGRY